jgi:NADPH:quinone reductase
MQNAPALPITMKVIDHGNGGGATCMRLIDAALPAFSEEEVLIKVHAAGVNRPDVAQRSGKYPPPADASPYMGLELSGEVVAAGRAVTRWQIGDHVCALTHGGAYAQYCAVNAAHCLPVPSSLSMLEAAAVPETFFTVWANVFQRAQFAAGNTILIHGGSSGIGSTAIQLTKLFGASKIIVTCGNQAKIDYCLKLGAHVGINYSTQDFVEVTKAATDGRGADVVVDMVGAPYFQKNIDVCATDGRIAQIALQHGAKTELNMQALMVRRLTWTGSTLRARSKAAKAEIAASLEKEVWPFFESNPNALRPNIHAVFTLSDVIGAHQMMEAGTHFGKIVLQVI